MFFEKRWRGCFYTPTGDFLGSNGIDDKRVFLADGDVDVNSLLKYKMEHDLSTIFGLDSDRNVDLQEVDGLIVVTREIETDKYTSGKFEVVTGDFSLKGATLEREGPDTKTPNKKKRIPSGMYNMEKPKDEAMPE